MSTETGPDTLGITVEDAPIIGPPADEPRRGPGRPKGSKNRRDRPPISRRSRASSHPKPTAEQMHDALAELLTTPAVPYSMLGHDYPAQHVIRTGPELATALIALSNQNDWFRQKLESFATGDSAVGMLMLASMVTMSVTTYIVPQLAYFGVIPTHMATRFGGQPIPQTRQAPQNAPSVTAQERPIATPEPTPEPEPDPEPENGTFFPMGDFPAWSPEMMMHATQGVTVADDTDTPATTET